MKKAIIDEGNAYGKRITDPYINKKFEEINTILMTPYSDKDLEDKLMEINQIKDN